MSSSSFLYLIILFIFLRAGTMFFLRIFFFCFSHHKTYFSFITLLYLLQLPRDKKCFIFLFWIYLFRASNVFSQQWNFLVGDFPLYIYICCIRFHLIRLMLSSSVSMLSSMFRLQFNVRIAPTNIIIELCFLSLPVNG